MILTSLLRCSAKKPPMNSIQLYKYLLRQCDRLPKDAQKFYKHSIRQNYKQHVNESDAERISTMITKTLEDAHWILNKYTKR